jgi:hypothetical protein
MVVEYPIDERLVAGRSHGGQKKPLFDLEVRDELVVELRHDLVPGLANGTRVPALRRERGTPCQRQCMMMVPG